MYKVDLYLRVRREGMVEGMSIREAAREFGLHRDTVRKILAYSVPPGYRRQTSARRPNPSTSSRGALHGGHRPDLGKGSQRPQEAAPHRERIFERLRTRYGFGGVYTTVKDYVREHRRQTREMFVPLSHQPGHARCDFGEALVIIAGV